MKVGVGSYAFRWSIGMGEHVPSAPLTPVALLERAASLGAEVVQIADNLPMHGVSAEDMTTLAEVAGDVGVELELGTDGASSGNLERYLHLAGVLDARVVRLTLDRKDLAAARSTLAERLEAAGVLYAREGRVIAIENHFLLPSNELAELVEQVSCPAVGVCLDVANSLANSESPADTITRLAPHALNVHLKDYRIEIDSHGVGMRVVGVPVGEGETDVAGALAALYSAGRDVNIVVEHWLPWELAAAPSEGGVLTVEENWTRQSLAAIREVMARQQTTGRPPTSR